MEITEAKKIVKALKYDQYTYFKPLPYTGVKGGTTITFDPQTKVFHEHYLNESLYDRGREEFTQAYTENSLIQMFVNEAYTDQKYPLSTKSETYQLIPPTASSS